MASGPNNDPIPIPKRAGTATKKTGSTNKNYTTKISFNEEAVEKEKKACLERGPPWCHRVLNERKELQAPWFVLGNSDGDPELGGGGFLCQEEEEGTCGLGLKEARMGAMPRKD
jgi:hypothetical protein